MRHLFPRLILGRNLLFQQNVNILLCDNFITPLLRNSLFRNLSSLADERKGKSLEELLEELARQEPPRWFMEKYTCPNLDYTLRDEDVTETVMDCNSEDSKQFTPPLGVEPTASCVELRHIPTNALVKVQEFRVLELNRTLARQLLAEKVDLITKGKDSVIHQYNERRKQMEQLEKEARVRLQQRRVQKRNDWNSGFGKKFQRDRNFSNQESHNRGRRQNSDSNSVQNNDRNSRDEWDDDFW